MELHERSVGKQLAALGFRRLSMRPQHPKSDPEAQLAFKKNFPDAVAAAIPARAQDRPLEIWFQEFAMGAANGSRSMADARIGQQGTLTRIWARRGTRPRTPRDTHYQWSYIFGAICPARGAAAGLILPLVNTEAMNAHLAEIARTVSPGAYAILVLDGAGWHGARGLVIPDNISLLSLPPYSPELNPAENVWAYLRTNKLAITVFDTYDDIVDACCTAWNSFANDPKAIASITSRHWAQVS